VILNSRNADLTERRNLEPYASDRFDRIYHLAAWTKAGEFCLYHKGEQWLINQDINTNVLWFWRKFQHNATLIAMGSSCSYAPNQDLREENYMSGEPDFDLYTYAMTKRMLLQGLRALHDQYDMSYRYLVPSTLYGPRFDLEDNHFIFDLTRKIVRGHLFGDPVVLWGDGSQVRELIHVRDAVRLIDFAVNNCPNEVVNLGTGEGHTIREYADAISSAVGYDPSKIEYDESRYTGVRHKVLNIQKLRGLFVDVDFVTVKQGVREVVDYYVGHITNSAAAAAGVPRPT
jgi:GDP-L-fucose synthase